MKLHGLYRKSYTEKQFQKKIASRIRIPQDQKTLLALVVKDNDPKTGKTRVSFDTSKVVDKKAIKGLNRIAKDIKKQKGRINIVTVAMALALSVALFLALVVFRNVIARIAITNALQNTFGARCEIDDIDVNLLTTRFYLKGLSVANKDKPMKNLFEIGTFELDFNLLELTRAKLVSENTEITGITWNTDRAVSGELPPKKAKKIAERKASKPNPVVAGILAQKDKVASEVSVDAGLQSLQDQFDPRVMIEKEKANLKSPAIVAEITEKVPTMSERWEKKGPELKAEVDATAKEVKRLQGIQVSSIKTVEEVRTLLAEVDSAKKSFSRSYGLAKEHADAVQADIKTVKALSSEAEAALKADQKRLALLADQVKSINLDSGKKMISSSFTTFLVATLGSYYPYLDKAMSSFKDFQSSSKKDKPQSLKKKAGAVSRLPGREISFAANSLPKVVFRSINLSARDSASGIEGAGGIKNLSNDADALGVPATFTASLAHGTMSERLSGTIDARTGSAVPFSADFIASGYPLKIDTGGTGVPVIGGNLSATGNLSVKADSSVLINALMNVKPAKVGIAQFNPSFLYTATRDALASVSSIALDVGVGVSPQGEVSLELSSDVDDQVFAALQQTLKNKVAEVKAALKKEAEAYIAGQKGAYSKELARFTSASSLITSSLTDIKGQEKVLDQKKAELDKRVKDIAAEKADAAAAPLKKDAEKQLDGALKNAPKVKFP
jgi:uncharacterized protein (TIGR03545 family)